MERVIIYLAMLVFILGLCANAVLGATVTYSASENTWIVANSTACVDCNNSNMHYYKNAGGDLLINRYLRYNETVYSQSNNYFNISGFIGFNVTPAYNHILTNITFKFSAFSSGTSNARKYLYYINGTNWWSENWSTYANTTIPTDIKISRRFGFGDSSPSPTASFYNWDYGVFDTDIAYPTFWTDLYKSALNNITFMVNGTMATGSTDYYILNAKESFDCRNNANYCPSITYTYVDTVTYLYTGTGVTDTYYDFNSGALSQTNPTTWLSHFHYDSINNNLFANIPFAFVKDETNTGFTLDDVDCSSVSGYTKTSFYSGVNLPAGTYKTFCFNLTEDTANGNLGGHQSPTYGAIKIINNATTNNQLIWIKIYSSSATYCGDKSYSPNPAQAGQNITFTWTTNNPTTTTLYLRYATPNSNFTPWIKFTNGTLIKDHSFTLNNYYVFNALYHYFLSGSDSVGVETNCTDQIQTIAIGYNQVFNNTNATLPIAIQDLSTNTGISATSWSYLFGIILLMFSTLIAVLFGGMTMGLGVFVTALVFESAVGFLPFFLLVPIIVITALVVVMIFRRVIMGRGNE